jgi:[ribosomal protein S5]-alanine N-acetyltransferase
LRLEPWAAPRREEFVALAADERVTRYVGNGAPWSRDEAEAHFEASLAHWAAHGFGKRSVIAKDTGAWLGFVELCHVGPGAIEVVGEIEIGWWLAPGVWGRGIATEAALPVRDAAFERLRLERIVGRYRPANVASRRIMEKLGMRFERRSVGRHGDAVDIFALDRDGWLAARERERYAASRSESSSGSEGAASSGAESGRG